MNAYPVSAFREVNQVVRLVTLGTLFLAGFVVACVRAQAPEERSSGCVTTSS